MPRLSWVSGVKERPPGEFVPPWDRVKPASSERRRTAAPGIRPAVSNDLDERPL